MIKGTPVLTTIAEVYEALDDLHIEITCYEEGEEWFWRNTDTGEEGKHAFAFSDNAAIHAAEEFGIEVDIDVQVDDEPEYYDDMDGDHASALASAGFGTDEDYGCFGEEDY